MTRFMCALTASAMLTGCGATEPAPNPAPNPALNPAPDREPDTRPIQPIAPSESETVEVELVPSAPVEGEPLQSTASEPAAPGWYSAEPGEYQGQPAACAFADADNVRDARRAAVDAAASAFRNAFPGHRSKIVRTAPVLMPDSTYRVYVLAGADTEPRR